MKHCHSERVSRRGGIPLEQELPVSHPYTEASGPSVGIPRRPRLLPFGLELMAERSGLLGMTLIRNDTITMMRPGLDFIGVNVVFFCHDDSGIILLHQRSPKCRDEHYTWDVGSGRVQHGERLEEALIREIKEEYGCDIIKHSHCSQLEVFREHDGRKTHWLANIYVVQVNSEQVRVMEPEKNLGNAWCTFENLPDPLHSTVASYLSDHGDRIRLLINNHIGHER